MENPGFKRVFTFLSILGLLAHYQFFLDVDSHNEDLCLKLVVLQRVRYNLGVLSVGRLMTASLYKH